MAEKGKDGRSEEAEASRLKTESDTHDGDHDQNVVESTTLEQARRFLEDDEVKNASRERKIAFLEKKGLRGDVITELVDASSTTNEETTVPDTKQSNTQLPPTNIPPIITYPEYLLRPPPSKPLLTATRLRNTLYLFGGLMAILHGTKQYLYTPMLEALTEARVSFAGIVQRNLSTLNQRLEEKVSVIPPDARVPPKRRSDQDTDPDEDPTELFHRDVGVQTSIPTSPTASSGHSTPSFPPPTTLSHQHDQISHLRALLTSLHTDHVSEAEDISELHTTIDILREYCESMSHPKRDMSTPLNWQSGNGRTLNGVGKEDEIEKLKRGIRGLKGMLLSTKSFPALKSGGGG